MAFLMASLVSFFFENAHFVVMIPTTPLGEVPMRRIVCYNISLRSTKRST